LNDPSFVESAEALARRVMKEAAADTNKRAAHAFRLCLSRAPQAKELKRLVALYDEELVRFKQDPAAAEKIAAAELGKPPENLDLAQLAAWTVVSNVLLNLDETITKE
jgi:hypothetical protein